MSDCIEHQGYFTKDGYGRVFFDGKHHLAHRVAYANTYGAIPEGMVIMHSCDNPACINTDHLKMGTQGDNIKDMHNKGRYKNGRIGKARAILAYNGSSGIIFKDYKEVTKAGYDISCVSACNKGKQNIHKGYNWMYL